MLPREPTPVIFRRYRLRRYLSGSGVVVALLPTWPSPYGNSPEFTCAVYESGGFIGEAHLPSFNRATEPASIREPGVATLFAEMERKGYRPMVVEKSTTAHVNQRRYLAAVAQGEREKHRETE